MRRLARCLVVSLLASTAVWGGCRDDLGDEDLSLAVGSGTADAAPIPDAGVGEGSGSDAAPIPDAGVGEGSGSDAAPIPDAGVGEGSGSDAAPIPDAGIGEGSGSDGGTTGDGGSDDSGGGGGGDDGGTAGRPDARRGPELDSSDRTSFYACAGSPASAGIEVGLPIALSLVIAVRRRRRWRATGSPDRAA